MKMVMLHTFQCFMVFHLAWFCPVSRETVTYVPSCPTSMKEWNQRAKVKNCSQFRQDCTRPEDFVYHCVINAFANATIEVCAPKKIIVDNRCAEFNIYAGILTESLAKTCNSFCPFDYNSTEAYKYQVCYVFGSQMCYCNSTEPTKSTFSKNLNGHANTIPTIRATTTEPVTCSEANFNTAVITVLLLLFIFFLSYAWYRYRKKKDKFKYSRIEMENEFQNMIAISSRSEIREDTQKNIEALIIAIDIGEKYLGLAYADSKNPSTIIPLHPMERISVLIRKPEEIIAVGREATKISNDMSDEDLSNHIYINEVQKKSYENKVAGESLQNKHILLAAIRDAFDIVRKQSETKQKKEDIKLVLSAAGHWSIYSKKLMEDVIKFEEPAIREKRKKMLFFMEKVDTISLFIRDDEASSICLNFNIGHLKIDDETIYAVLNVGYGSCHLSFLQGHELDQTQDKIDKKVTDGSRRLEWEKDAPEEKVWDECQKVLSEKYISAYNHEKIKSQYDLHHEKIRKCQNDETSFQFELLRDDLKGDFKSKENVDGIEIKETEDKVIISFKWKVLRKCYNDLENKVSKVIKEYRECFDDYNVKCVFLVGGYNILDFIQESAKTKWFPNITVVIPNDGGVCFAMGAASAYATK